MTRETPQEKRVHELRRHVKRLRALARLLEQLGARNAHDINERLGSLGRELSDERDLTVRNAWLEKNGFPELMLPHPRAASLKAPSSAVKKEETKLRHEAALARLSPPRIEAALKSTARKAHRARKKAKAKRSTDDFHRWRKRVRDLVEQSKLLGLPEEESLKRQVKQLGKAQDTVVVAEGLRKVPGAKPAKMAAKKEGQQRRKKALKEKPSPTLKVNPIHLKNLQTFLKPKTKRSTKPTASLPVEK